VFDVIDIDYDEYIVEYFVTVLVDELEQCTVHTQH